MKYEKFVMGRYQIGRLVTEQTWRGTPSAKFNWFRNPGEAWFMCDVYFENGVPKIGVRSFSDDLEMAHAISVALQMAIEWASERARIVQRLKDRQAASLRAYR